MTDYAIIVGMGIVGCTAFGALLALTDTALDWLARRAARDREQRRLAYRQARYKE